MIQACCQPSTLVFTNGWPSSSATQPALAFSGTDNTDSSPGATDTVREVGSQVLTSTARWGAGWVAAESGFGQESCNTKESERSVRSSWPPAPSSMPPSESEH